MLEHAMYKMSTLTPAPYEGAPTYTKVKGYYNSFSFPFDLHVPELNRHIMLGPREFICKVTDTIGPKGEVKRTKIKVNDPIFENFVGPNKLAKEEGSEDVPIVWLARPVVTTAPVNAFEFAGSDKFKTDADGNVITPGAIAAKQSQQMTSVPASAAAITGYSVEQARKFGIIKQTEPGRIPEVREIPEDTKVPPHAKPQPVPRGVAPVQPDYVRPVPPPFKPPVDDTVRMPVDSVTMPPPAAVVVPPSVAITPVVQAVSQPHASALPVDVTPEELNAASDLLEDVEADDKMSIESIDLAALAKQAAAKQGIVLPEPKVAEQPVAPIVQATPVVQATPTVPQEEKRQPRRYRRGEPPPITPVTPL